MTTECPAADGSSPRVTKFDGPPPMCIDPSKGYVAKMDTSMGEMTIALYPDKAPNTVNSFVVLARYHYYDGLIFHRIINGFVVQGGCPKGDGTGDPGYRLDDEFPGPGEYELGSVVMAKTAAPNTSGSQFFIVTGPNGVALPPQYSLFGKVVGGFEVANAMQQVKVGPGDRPITDVVINSVTIQETD